MFSGPIPATSSSATLTEMVGMSSAVTPASRSCLKKTTLLSPLRVLNTASGWESMILLTTVLNSVCPSGAYSSASTSIPYSSAYARMIKLAVRGKT